MSLPWRCGGEQDHVGTPLVLQWTSVWESSWCPAPSFEIHALFTSCRPSWAQRPAPGSAPAPAGPSRAGTAGLDVDLAVASPFLLACAGDNEVSE